MHGKILIVPTIHYQCMHRKNTGIQIADGVFAFKHVFIVYTFCMRLA